MKTQLFGAGYPASLWTRLLTGVVCAASLGGAAFAQEPPTTADTAGSKRFHARIAGTCSNKDDFSFTGVPAGLFPGAALRISCVVAGNSTQGRYTAQIFAEAQVTPNACTFAGAGGLEANIAAYLLVMSFNATHEQLFLTGNNGTECLTPPGTVAGGTGQLNVVGGTGRFEGATGSVLHIASPIALAFSALGGDGFISAFTGSLDGVITLQ